MHAARFNTSWIVIYTVPKYHRRVQFRRQNIKATHVIMLASNPMSLGSLIMVSVTASPMSQVRLTAVTKYHFVVRTLSVMSIAGHATTTQIRSEVYECIM